MAESLDPTSSTTNTGNIVTITAQTGLDGYRRRNFYMVNFFQGIIWMMFHFAVVFFFTFQLKSVALVGVFLGIANFISFLLDVPLGIVIRYFSAKKLFIIAAISQLIAMGIFFSLIFNVFQAAGIAIPTLWSDALAAAKEWFFTSAFSFILLLVAAMCYGFTKEINDITTFSYILSNANPSEYSEILARNNITFWVGSLLGLIASGFVLSLNPSVAIILLSVAIIAFMGFTLKFFHNATETVDIKDIEHFIVSIRKANKEDIKEYITTTVSKAELATILEKTRYLFIKPHQKEASGFDWKTLIPKTKESLLSIWGIITSKPIHLSVIWTMSLVLTFGFWDTFAATFLIDFLDKVKPGMSYILLGIIALPAYGCQELFWKLASKLWVTTVGIFWLGLSGLSLILMGVFSFGTPGVVSVMACALLNSVGYAAGMSMWQNKFLEEYNEVYAKEKNLKEIDVNASSAPMKILQNMANVIGLVFGGILVGLGYPVFFILFGLVIIATMWWSLTRKSEIRL